MDGKHFVLLFICVMFYILYCGEVIRHWMFVINYIYIYIYIYSYKITELLRALSLVDSCV